ncbi:hypothetical protein [Georgenia yuyongxinii]|uniref:hypothetical protein n=1 Tax=Georgenia yuyongxinii TaxID=2589797 RepID=UPI00163D9E5E|nr:hypothetical protein [Georgenia yuyongxinii]
MPGPDDGTGGPVPWPDAVDEILRGDLVAALAYVTPAGGAVATTVAPCGLVDRGRGTVSFTTSLGFGRKLERLARDPSTALAFHTREHGFARAPGHVLVQGRSTIQLRVTPARVAEVTAHAERFLGPIRRGPVWDRLLREYYADRVVVDVAVSRVATWPDPTAVDEPVVVGPPWPGPPPSQRPPRDGVGPRVEIARTFRLVTALPHVVLAYRGSDRLPVVVPVTVAGRDGGGLRLRGPLPPGRRRAGLLAHGFRPGLVGLHTRVLTGWLVCDDAGGGHFAPHTSSGVYAPPVKSLLLVSNGLLAKYGEWKGRGDRASQGLTALLAAREAADAAAAADATPTGPSAPADTET